MGKIFSIQFGSRNEAKSHVTVANSCTRCSYESTSTTTASREAHSTVENADQLLKNLKSARLRVDQCPRCGSFCVGAFTFKPAL